MTTKRGPYSPKQLVNGTKLSGLEYQVFCLVGQGYGTEEIAEKLGRTTKRIDDLKQEARKKLHIRHHVAFCNYATREQVRREIRDGDYARDDLMADWLAAKLQDVSSSQLLDWILEFRMAMHQIGDLDHE